MIDLFGLVGKISIHAPRTGSDIGYAFAPFFRGIIFQSTLPARGATRRRAFSYAIALFQSTLPARGATPYNRRLLRRRRFQSTLPARGATQNARKLQKTCEISIHAPRTGSDGNDHGKSNCHLHFNPRSPHGERRDAGAKNPARCRFQSTLPARGATDWRTRKQPQRVISIHAPRTGSDRDDAQIIAWCAEFQSTLPARGATTVAGCCLCRWKYFNPRSPHGERRDGEYAMGGKTKYFNPRSPHGERHFSARLTAKHTIFQSTLPARGATCDAGKSILSLAISIHAPRTGSDACILPDSCFRKNFNPRSPHGERRTKTCGTKSPLHFNPRSPHGERLRQAAYAVYLPKFQSTLPARGATRIKPLHRVGVEISIHAPRTGSDAFEKIRSGISGISIHAPRTGSDTVAGCCLCRWKYFNPRSPHGERPLFFH